MDRQAAEGAYRRPVRLVTMADSSYLPGLGNLVHSVAMHSDVEDIEITIIFDGELRPELRDALLASGVRLEFVNQADLGYIEPMWFTLGRRRRTLQKLLVFNLPSAESMAFVDADMLCLGSLAGLEALPPLAVVPEHGFDDPTFCDGTPVFNSGFFTFVPNRDLFAEIIEFYDTATEPFGLGDQMVLNSFLHARRPGDVSFADRSWNTMTTRLSMEAEWPIDGIRFLHYVGHKPWGNMWIPFGATTPRIVDPYKVWWQHYAASPVGQVLGARHPPFWALRASHSRPARPMWTAARRGWTAVRSRPFAGSALDAARPRPAHAS